jgi:hypothetical protein
MATSSMMLAGELLKCAVVNQKIINEVGGFFPADYLSWEQSNKYSGKARPTVRQATG